MGLLSAHLAEHSARSSSSQSLTDLLAPREPAQLYTEPTDKRALVFQILALVIVLLLSAAMTFLLRM